MSDKISKHDYNVKAIAFINAHFLVTEYHYSKSSACTAVYSHGMFDKDGWIVGAAMWMPQLMKASVRTSQEAGFSDHRGVLHLSRLVCVPDLPGNSASFLLGRSMRLIDRKRWPVLVTYADTGMGHLGTIYKATNWRMIGEVKGGPVWRHCITGEIRGAHSSGNNTPFSVMRAMGFVQQPPAPKIKFIHVVK